MKSALGVWIDRRKAVIVAVKDTEEDVKELASFGEQKPGKGPTSGCGTRKAPADGSQERIAAGHLDKYYDNVITQLYDAEGIFIFGPDEAKDELVKRIEKVNLGGCITGVETAGKMTVQQIAAKVREYVRQ